MQNPPQTSQISSNFSAWLKLIILQENDANIIWWAILGFDSYANTCSFYFQSIRMLWSPNDRWPLARVILKYFCRERVMMFSPLLQTWPWSTPINTRLLWCDALRAHSVFVESDKSEHNAQHKGISAQSTVNPDLWWRVCVAQHKPSLMIHMMMMLVDVP